MGLTIKKGKRMWLMKYDINEIGCSFNKEEMAIFGYDFDKLTDDLQNQYGKSKRVSTFIELVLYLITVNGYCRKNEKIPMEVVFSLLNDELIIYFSAFVENDAFLFDNDIEIDVTSLIPTDKNGIERLLWNDCPTSNNKNDIIAIYFTKIDDMLNYVIYIESSRSSLYKMNDEYCLVCHFDNMDEKNVMKYKNFASEWGYEIHKNPMIETYMDEHGECMIKNNAIQGLKKINERK